MWPGVYVCFRPSCMVLLSSNFLNALQRTIFSKPPSPLPVHRRRPKRHAFGSMAADSAGRAGLSVTELPIQLADRSAARPPFQRPASPAINPCVPTRAAGPLNAGHPLFGSVVRKISEERTCFVCQCPHETDETQFSWYVGGNLRPQTPRKKVGPPVVGAAQVDICSPLCL